MGSFSRVTSGKSLIVVFLLKDVVQVVLFSIPPLHIGSRQQWKEVQAFRNVQCASFVLEDVAGSSSILLQDVADGVLLLLQDVFVLLLCVWRESSLRCSLSWRACRFRLGMILLIIFRNSTP